ncbi:MAG: TrkA family potassium uptake protein [Anaerostipes sp.]|nr:TrkA family potassium uptake protein [Anaerostipes sp.]
MAKSYAVFGLGKFGSSVAKNLMLNGAEVLAVDKSEELVRSIADDVTCAVCADVMDIEIMKTIGLDSVDGAVVATAESLEASVMAIMTAKELGVPYILAKADGHIKGEILKRVGADKVVYPETEMGKRIAYNLASGTIMDLIDLSKKTSVIEIHIKSQWVGKTLRQLDLRGKYSINVVAIHTGDEFDGSPDPDRILEATDSLIVIGDKKYIAKIR